MRPSLGRVSKSQAGKSFKDLMQRHGLGFGVLTVVSSSTSSSRSSSSSSSSRGGGGGGGGML